MSVLAIISEYNPYHNGHEYLLRRAKEETGDTCSLSVMSGNFTQQGLPMYTDKLTRAAAAAAGGIDLVFELPVLYATGSARDFAEGAVSLLHGLGSVRHLCFGVEDPDSSLFDSISECLLEEPALFREILSEKMKAGKNYPAAREEALSAVLGEQTRSILRKPNNILGIEYITALKRLNSSIRPVLIRREGNYHPKTTTESPAGTSDPQERSEGSFVSATEIRDTLRLLYQNAPGNAEDYLARVMPEGVPSYFLPLPPPITEDLLTPFLVSALIRAGEEAPSDAGLPMDMTASLFRRLSSVPLPATWNEIVEQLNTRDMTRGRITRALLHMILGIRNQDRDITRNPETGVLTAPYAALLAARSASTGILRELRDHSSIPIITRRAAYRPDAGSAEEMLRTFDKRATALYHQLCFETRGLRLSDEMRSTPVIL